MRLGVSCLLYLDMVEDAVVLSNRDGFSQDIVEKLGSRLRKLGAGRIQVGRR